MEISGKKKKIFIYSTLLFITCILVYFSIFSEFFRMNKIPRAAIFYECLKTRILEYKIRASDDREKTIKEINKKARDTWGNPYNIFYFKDRDLLIILSKGENGRSSEAAYIKWFEDNKYIVPYVIWIIDEDDIVRTSRPGSGEEANWGRFVYYDKYYYVDNIAQFILTIFIDY